MRYELATKDQLWAILRNDSECPLPLLEGAFSEAVNRGMIKNFILGAIKQRFGTYANATHQLNMTLDDIIQLGYVGALTGLKKFKPGTTTLTTFLFMRITSAFRDQLVYESRDKRQGEVISYDQPISDSEDTLANLYLVDHYTNVEKTVLTKLQLEEKLATLSPIQKETFIKLFKGYNYAEIAELMETNRDTVASRLRAAFIRMTGAVIDIRSMGITERPNVKKRGA